MKKFKIRKITTVNENNENYEQYDMRFSELAMSQDVIFIVDFKDNVFEGKIKRYVDWEHCTKEELNIIACLIKESGQMKQDYSSILKRHKESLKQKKASLT